MAGAEIDGVGSLLKTLDGIERRWTSSASGTVSTGVEYAVYVEFGTRNMAAQPFMRPAAERVERRLGELARSAIGLDDLVRRATIAVEAEAKLLAPVDTGQLRASIRADFDGSSTSVSGVF